MDIDDLLPVTMIDSHENFIIKLNQYWPQGLKTASNTATVNKDLLYLFSHKIPAAYTLCTCPMNGFEYRELTKMYEYEFDNEKFEVYDEGNLEAINGSHRKPLQILKFLEFPCCHFRLYHEDVDIYQCKAMKFFYQKKRISFYLNLKELTESRTIPGCLVNDLNLKFSSLFRNGLIGKIQKKFKPGNTLNYEPIQMDNGFPLKLEDFQLRTISWMESVENSLKLEKGSIQYRNDNSNQNLPNVKIQFGDLNFFIGLNGPFMLSQTPKTAKPYKAPVNGGFLAELTDVDSQGTIIGMLHYKLKTLNNTFRVNDVVICSDQKYYFNSRANLIVCVDPIKWIEPLKVSFPNLNLIQYKQSEYSWNDLITADIILCTFDQLNELNLIKKFNWKDEEVINGVGNLFHCKYPRIFFDSINETVVPLFDQFKRDKKVLKSDFKWGILEDYDELSSSLMDFFGFSGSLIEDPFAYNQFIKTYVQRHDITHLLPELIEEYQVIQLTTREKMMINRRKAGRSENNYKMAVLDYYFYGMDRFKDLKVKDLNQIEKKFLSSASMKEIEALERELEKESNDSRMAVITGKLEALKRLQKYAEETFKSLHDCDESNKRTCPICYDEIQAESYGILSCCHLFCYECVVWYVENYGKCPLCSKITQTVTPFTLNVIDNFEIEQESGLKVEDFGSKFINVYLYILLLLKIEEVKIIIHVQYKELKERIYSILQSLNLAILVLRVETKPEMIQDEFQNGKGKLILICKEDKGNKMNLTAATHILLLHPFEDLRTEMYGIRMAYRLGLEHPLKVVRFVVGNSIEQEQCEENRRND